jgi:hypothetical protein
MFGLEINPKKIKEQNTSYLKSIGIEVINHLPYIDLNEFQSDKDIARRCLVMAALLQLNFGAPNEFIENWLNENNLMEYLTPNEQHILGTKFSDLTEQEQTDLYWTIEAIWALSWVGKKHSNLTFNTGVEDTLANMLPSFQNNESGAEFIEKFKSKPKKEIFTMLDRFYRAHWYARNNNLTGKDDPNANIDLIMERRKALEWVCNKNEEWDDISLDT